VVVVILLRWITMAGRKQNWGYDDDDEETYREVS